MWLCTLCPCALKYSGRMQYCTSRRGHLEAGARYTKHCRHGGGKDLGGFGSAGCLVMVSLVSQSSGSLPTRLASGYAMPLTIVPCHRNTLQKIVGLFATDSWGMSNVFLGVCDSVRWLSASWPHGQNNIDYRALCVIYAGG